MVVRLGTQNAVGCCFLSESLVAFSCSVDLALLSEDRKALLQSKWLDPQAETSPRLGSCVLGPAVSVSEEVLTTQSGAKGLTAPPDTCLLPASPLPALPPIGNH